MKVWYYENLIQNDYYLQKLEAMTILDNVFPKSVKFILIVVADF